MFCNELVSGVVAVEEKRVSPSMSPGGNCSEERAFEGDLGK